MLSRFALLRCPAQCSPLLTKFLSTAPPSGSKPPQVPTESSKRDLINFPRPQMVLENPPTRFGIIPDTWFQFFYPKTGVTGPYMLLFGGGLYLFSKEIIVMDHNYTNGLSYILMIIIIKYKFGDKIAEFHKKTVDDYEKMLDEPQEREKKQSYAALAELEKFTNYKALYIEAGKAKKENILLQIEAAYRGRLVEAYNKVKRRLDCLAELENAERRIVQKNMMDYVITNVMKSITPDLENNAMRSCIENLNTLSARA